MLEPVDLEMVMQGLWSARALDANRLELHTQGSQVLRLPSMHAEQWEEIAFLPGPRSCV